MIYKKLGNSNLKVSLIGYGSWALSKKGWKDVNQEEAIRTLEKSFKLGINFYDTAPIYGFGKSEELIGEVLSSVRSQMVIATKFGLEWNNYGKVTHNLNRDFILKEIENSLKRLKTDYIDLYQIHWPDTKTPLEEVFITLEDLKRQNIIRNIGVSNFNFDLLKKASSITNITSTQECYNILQTDIEKEILPYCKKKNIGVISYSSLAQGLLSGKIDKNYKFSKSDIRRFNPLFADLNNTLDKINTFEKPVLNSAMNYLFKNDNVSSILISMTKMKHLEENIKILEKYFEKL